MRHCLLYLLLIGSGFTVIAQDTPVQLQIKPCYKEQAISLEDGPIEIEGTSLKIETIRFYISGISLWHKGELVWAEKTATILLTWKTLKVAPLISFTIPAFHSTR